MDNLAELLKQELEDAVEVKDKKSLNRYTRLLADNIVPRERYEQHQLRIENEIKMLTETMKLGFEVVNKRFEAVDKRFEAVDKRFEDMYRYMNKRFEAVDKRFEDMNNRFNMMFAFMTFGFSVLAVLMTLYKFIFE